MKTLLSLTAAPHQEKAERPFAFALDRYANLDLTEVSEEALFRQLLDDDIDMDGIEDLDLNSWPDTLEMSYNDSRAWQMTGSDHGQPSHPGASWTEGVLGPEGLSPPPDHNQIIEEDITLTGWSEDAEQALPESPQRDPTSVASNENRDETSCDESHPPGYHVIIERSGMAREETTLYDEDLETRKLDPDLKEPKKEVGVRYRNALLRIPSVKSAGLKNHDFQPLWHILNGIVTSNVGKVLSIGYADDLATFCAVAKTVNPNHCWFKCKWLDDVSGESCGNLAAPGRWYTRYTDEVTRRRFKAEDPAKTLRFRCGAHSKEEEICSSEGGRPSAVDMKARLTAFAEEQGKVTVRRCFGQGRYA